MRACFQLQMISMMVVLVHIQMAMSFMVGGLRLGLGQARSTSMMSPMNLNALPEKVEVCGNKDCRRAGGGAKLEKLVSTVSSTQNSKCWTYWSLFIPAIAIPLAGFIRPDRDRFLFDTII